MQRYIGAVQPVGDFMNRHSHILNASTNLLGICFLIISGLKFANLNARSYADEFSWVAAMLLFTSTLVAYLALRNEDSKAWQTRLADRAFIGGVITLMTAVTVAAIYL
jgi:hypothetical protein